MCGSVVDIQSATAEIRRGIKKDRKKKPQLKNIMSASATQGGRNKNAKMYRTREPRCRVVYRVYRIPYARSSLYARSLYFRVQMHSNTSLFRKILSENITKDSKSFSAYVHARSRATRKLGPLTDNGGTLLSSVKV